METLFDVRVSTTWKDAFAGYLVETGCSERTVRAYSQDLRSFEKWFFQVNRQALAPELITGVDMRAYRTHSLETEQVRPTTWNRRRATLRALCSWAQSAGLLAYDPFQGVEAAEEVPLPPRWLTHSEYARVMRAVELLVNGAKTALQGRQAVRDQAMLCLMVYAGLREGEVVSLDHSDVELSERKGRVIVRLGKGGKRREVPLNAEARRALARWIDLGVTQEGAFFVGKSAGERLTTRSVERSIKRIGLLAGIETLSTHVLRHTCAKRMLDAGVPLTVVSRILGHARLETTARYVQPGWEDYESAVERI